MPCLPHPTVRSLAFWGIFLLPGLVWGEELHRRLLFLGTEAPYILDVTISTGRFNLAETRQRYAQGVFERLDRDHDGQLSPEEAADIPVGGRLIANAPVLGEAWKSLDVSPEDGAISLEELAAHLNRTLGPELAIVRQPPRLAQTVRLNVDLDLNGDGRIDGDEVELGLLHLRAFDFDDDEALSVAELQPFPQSVRQAQLQEQVEAEPLPLLVLSSDEDYRTAAERCLAHYGQAAGEIPAEQLSGIVERRFKIFDRDRSGGWNESELDLFLRKAPPDQKLAVTLAPARVSVAGQNSLDNRPVLDLGGLPVECVARSNSWQADSAVKLQKIRFRQSDRDKNGYLDQQEFSGLQAGDARFESVDLDGNGQVTVDEVERYFTLDALAQQCQLVITVSDITKTLFEILDEDKDQRLTPREIRTSRLRLLEYDRNGDQALVSAELASQMRLTFSQPELLTILPEPGMMMNNPGTGIISEPTAGPLWFRRMDGNRDGEVSWKEFLGPREKFDQLDLNGDGVIDLEEAQHVP